MTPDTLVILAGGKGTRLSEKTGEIPKPLLPVQGKPIIQHIINHFANHGIKRFVVLTGYLGYKIFDYFSEHAASVVRDSSPDLPDHLITCGDGNMVTVVDTGEESLTGGRLKIARPFLPSKFWMTYGDGLSDVDPWEIWTTHTLRNYACTITAVHPVPRFGAMEIYGTKVTDFGEKMDNQGWINGGFMLMNESVIDLIGHPLVNLEQEILPKLVERGTLGAYKHEGNWHCIDTLRDLQNAENLEWINE